MMDPLTHAVRPFKWRRSRKPLSLEVQSTYRILVGTLLFLAISSTGTYLYMNSRGPAKGYELKQLQIDYESLQSDLRKLDRNVVEAQSFIHLEGSEILQEMEVTEDQDLSYLEESGFAQNSDTSSMTDD